MLVTGWEGLRVTEAVAWASLAAWSCWEAAGAVINSGVALERGQGGGGGRGGRRQTRVYFDLMQRSTFLAFSSEAKSRSEAATDCLQLLSMHLYLVYTGVSLAGYSFTFLSRVHSIYCLTRSVGHTHLFLAPLHEFWTESERRAPHDSNKV